MRWRNILLNIIFEVVLPFLTMLIPLWIFSVIFEPPPPLPPEPIYSLPVVMFFTILFPMIVTSIQRSIPVKKRILDLYFLAACWLSLWSFAFWPPAIVVEFLFCGVLYIYIAIGPKAHVKIFFFVLYIIAILLLALSGATPLSREAMLFLLVIFLLSVTVWPNLYLQRIGNVRFPKRPTVALLTSIIYFTFISFIFYSVGARTSWLTQFVSSQQGVSLVFSPTAKFTSARIVIPTQDGLILNTGRAGKFQILRAQKLTSFPPRILNEVKQWSISFVCDPDDKSICYIGTYVNKKGIAIVNTSSWQIEYVDFKHYFRDYYENTPSPEPLYPMVVSDRQKNFLAAVEHTARHVVVAKRIYAGNLEIVGDLRFDYLFNPSFINQCFKCFFVDFSNGNLIVIINSKGFLHGFTYDIETRDLYKFLEIKGLSDVCWHGAVIEGKLIVIPTFLTGRFIILNMLGEKIGGSQLLPFLRYTVYDPQRRLCYIVSDLGFLFVYDPWQSKNIKTLFLGFKTKSVYHEGDYLYVSSTAGIFKINIDEAIARDAAI